MCRLFVGKDGNRPALPGATGARRQSVIAAEEPEHIDKFWRCPPLFEKTRTFFKDLLVSNSYGLNPTAAAAITGRQGPQMELRIGHFQPPLRPVRPVSCRSYFR